MNIFPSDIIRIIYDYDYVDNYKRLDKMNKEFKRKYTFSNEIRCDNRSWIQSFFSSFKTLRFNWNLDSYDIFLSTIPSGGFPPGFFIN